MAATTADTYVLALDGGTESVRAGVIDPQGRPVVFARSPYATRHPRPGWAEQDPADWWAAVVDATRQVLAAGIDPGSIVAISAACTSCTVVFCDDDGTPLRPALLWMDVRAAEQGRRIGALDDPALRVNGSAPVSAEWLLPKTLWITEHEPRTYDRAARVAEYTDWLGHRLTGEWAANVNTAAIRAHYDRLAGGWPRSLHAAIGLDDLVDKLPSRVLDLGDTLGGLSARAAAELGLPAGVPVAAGGADAFVGQIGLDVVTPGRAALITGSSHLHLLQTATPSHAPGMWGTYTDAVVPGQFTAEGGQTSTGSVVKWYRQLVDGHCFGFERLPSEEAYRRLQREAQDLPPGSEGVLALEYWQGNRTPYVDGEARGMIWGLSLHHSTAHIFRALIEAACFGTETIFRTFAAAGHPVTDVVACGGAIQSELWLQIHADVSNLPITVTAVPEAVTLGAGILASVAGGWYPDVPAAAGAMVRVARTVEPDPRAAEEYRFFYQRYVASYGAMRELMHEVVRHVSA